MGVRIAVLASGGGTNLQAIIDFNAARGALAAGSIALVASNRTNAGALDRARRASIPTATFDAADDGNSLIDLLKSHRIELVVLAGYLKRLPPAVIRSYPNRILNVHPGLLPEFGGAGMYGARVHAAVLASGAATSGVTVHFVDDDFDHGQTIAEWRVQVRDDDTAESLAARVLAVEHIVYPRVIDLVASLNNSNYFADF
jgi:formyltetrahydrofolate-dependent phosphoribosylglycinamide formyltransferase